MKKLVIKLPERRSSKAIRRYTRSKFGNFIFFAFLFFFGAFSVLPLVYSLVTSFKPIDELLMFPPTLFIVKRPTLNNYLALPDLISGLNVPLSRYLTNSLFISIAGTVLHVLVATAASFILSKTDLKYKNIIFLVIQVSLLFNAYTLAIPRYLIYNGLGIIDTYWAYLLPAIPSSMGVFLMKQYMDGYIPDALIEASKIDGANYIRIFWSIILPNVKPCVLTLSLFAFQSIWATIPSGTIFNESLKTLPTVMSTISAGGIARSGASMAATVIMMIPPIAFYLFSQSSVKETMGSAGIKG
ncbi:MAG: carbohydrate ABC transporter permease [Clostridia bacterium]|nr:carbohydrate ABC transporter permease [Clostridia bacterium]